MKKALKVLSRILLVILILIILTLIFCFFYQKIGQKKDRELLEKDGFCHLYDAGDYKMNINIYDEGKNKIIAMPGNGDTDFTVDMKVFSEYLSDDISLVVVTRPGYGLCEETDHDITTEYIVDSTRTALKNAGIEGPYILMPHSLSGIYGTYWESTYPDEVSGVIFLDSINEAQPEITDENWTEPPAVMKFLCKAGLFRVIADLQDSDDESDPYSNDLDALYDVNPTAFSKSGISELKNFNRNMKTAWASIKANDIPKIYISTNYQSLDDAKDYLMYINGEADEAEAKEQFNEQQTDEQKEYRSKRSEYIDKLGNCKEINIPGSHFIYSQKPEALAKVISDFIGELK